MPRKIEPAYETENGVFPKRLKKIMKERGENQTSLAKKITEQYITIQRQTISLYMSGQSKPDTERLTAIAKVLNVSADWLLGLTNDKNVQVRAVDMLGISSAAMDNLLRCSIDFPEIISKLFSSDGFWGLMAQISRLKKQVQTTKEAHKIVHKEGFTKSFEKSNAIKSIENVLGDFLGYPVSFVEPHHQLYFTLNGIQISAEELAKEISGYNDLTSAELVDHIYDFDSREINDFLKYIDGIERE